jgi:hypothetical protein
MPITDMTSPARKRFAGRNSLARSRVAELATAVPMEVIMDHSKMDALDLLVYLIAFNLGNLFLVVEALAGTGKTSMLTGLVARLPNAQVVLLLSFTRSAVRVARTRLREEKVHIQSQTFDSIFYHAVRGCMGVPEDEEELTFQDYRDLARYLDVAVLTSFQCKARDKYSLRDIEYVLVDEAQDTPPGAIDFLQRLRELGKTVIIVGDRRQAIFGFQGAHNLFDDIPRHQKITQTLRISRRCRWHVADYVNQRFHTDMRSIDGPETAPSEIALVVVQTRCNKTLGRIFARFLFTLMAPCAVDVAEGNSEEIFREAFLDEIQRMYKLSREGAETVAEERQRMLRVTPDDACRWIFSTVHRYKGDEGDITVLADDIAPNVMGNDNMEECVKYVAATRAKWGIVDLQQALFHGHPDAKRLFRNHLASVRGETGTNHVGAVVASPVAMLFATVASTLSLDIPRSFARCAGVWDQQQQPPRSEYAPPIYGIADTLLAWDLEARAREVSCPTVAAQLHLDARLQHDFLYNGKFKEGAVPFGAHQKLRKKLNSLKWKAMVSRAAAVSRVWGITQECTIEGAACSGALSSFVASKSIRTLKVDWGHVENIRRRLQQLFAIPRACHGVLADARQWRLVIIRQTFGSGPVAVKGSFDVCVVDATQKSTVVVCKFTQRSSFHNFLALAWSTAALTNNGGVVIDNAVLYNAIHDTWNPIDVSQCGQAVQPHDEFRNAVSPRICSVYYNRQMTLEQISDVADS